jgi:Fur family transcriptional regulator, stress-responsive regulator
MGRTAAMSEVMKRRYEGQFRQLCREKGIPFTAQRRAVLQAVLELGSHPTAGEVFASAVVRRARVSRATVYRTLESLARLGAAIKVGHGGCSIRYDARVELHHHLVCQGCNTIMDIANSQLDRIPIPDVRKFGFVVKDFRVQLNGLCRNCLINKKKHQQ